MTIEIDPEDLRNELIIIYTYYLSNDEELKRKAEEMAMNLDGLWSGSFLFPEEIEKALGGLTYLYVEPKISKEKAKKILEDLVNGKS